MYDDDIRTIKKLKEYSEKRRKSFSSIINSKNLSQEEMDELFLSY